VDVHEFAPGGLDAAHRGGVDPAHQLRDRAVEVAVEEEGGVARQGPAHLDGELADDAEVDVADGVAWQHEEVGRMQIGVEKAGDVDLVEHVPVEVADDAPEVVPALAQAVEVDAVVVPHRVHNLDQRKALDQVEREDAGGREAPPDPWHALQGIPGRVLAQADRLSRLDDEVELVRRPFGKLVDHLPAARRSEEPDPTQETRERVHKLNVGRKNLARVRPLDLDRDPMAGVQDRPVYLSNRCCGKRRRVEFAKDRLGIIAEFPPDDVTHVLVRDRLDLVKQLDEFVAVGGWQQVEPHCQHLPEFDPGPAEALQREAKLDRIKPAPAPRERREDDAVPDKNSDGLRGACQSAPGRDQPAPLRDRRSGGRGDRRGTNAWRERTLQAVVRRDHPVDGALLHVVVGEGDPAAARRAQ
jgi:hypothetical protein